MANKIYGFVESHDNFIRQSTKELLVQMNTTVQRIPQVRAFRVGKRRIIKDGIMREVDEDDHALDDSLNVGESRDLDNRMCCDKILSLLKDYIMKENISAKQAFGVDAITPDIAMEKEHLKYKIK